MKKIHFILILITVGCISCVPMNKFKSTQTENSNLNSEIAKIKRENRNLSEENSEMKSQLGVLKSQLEVKNKESIDNALLVSKLKEEISSLQSNYDRLKESQDAFVSGSSRETRRLLEEIQSTQSELQKYEDELKAYENSLIANKDKLDDYEKILTQERERLNLMAEQLEAGRNKVEDLERILREKEESVARLKAKVDQALRGFKNSELSVYSKNGKVYVSLEEQLLFQSGSYSVDTKGVNALTKLATVLAQNKDINIMVEGHTDDVPMNGTGAVKDNWDLSVLRATSIVKIILKNKGVTPVRITAAGHGEFMPIDAAKTKEARQKNRRTEIILTPKLDEIFQILENN